MASLASSGIKALSSLFARSWSRKALRVLRKSAANSAQEFDALISTIRIASMRGRIARSARTLYQDAEIQRVHGDRDLDPLAASGDNRERRGP
jgi:hypothetical protein